MHPGNAVWEQNALGSSGGTENLNGRAGFEQEVFEHVDSLYNTAVYLTGDPAKAMDVVSLTTLHAYRFFRLYGYQPNTGFRVWLFRVLRKTLRERHAEETGEFSRKLREEDEGEWLPNEVPGDPSIAPGLETESSETHLQEKVAQYLVQLPRKLKEVLLLRDVEQFRYREIAEILEVPMATVRSRLASARNHMRISLLEHAAQPKEKS